MNAVVLLSLICLGYLKITSLPELYKATYTKLSTYSVKGVQLHDLSSLSLSDNTSHLFNPVIIMF